MFRTTVRPEDPMPDSEPDAKAAKPIPVRPPDGGAPRPEPARGDRNAPGGRKAGGGRSRRGRDGGRRRDRGKGRKPTPVREAVGAGGGPRVEPDLEEAAFTVEGVEWVARVRGRSGGAGAPPLLLVGFRRSELAGDAPERETLVVARTLDGLGEDRLAAALESASEPVDPGERRPFFEDVGDARRR